MILRVKPGILKGMSENGPVLPPEVYRRRRIVAVIALLAVILLLVAGVTSMVGMINGKKDATVASTATASGAPFQSFSARPSETASATPSASATASATASASATATASASASATPSVTASAAPTASATTATPAATPTTPAPTPSVTTAAVAAACTANDLKVTVTPAKRTFAAGEQVSFHVTYTNSSKTPCAVGGEGANTGVDLNITSGAAQVYTRSLCAATAVQKAEVAAGAEGATDLAWDRKINVLGCSSASTAQKGSYWASATVNGVSSAPVNFIIQ